MSFIIDIRMGQGNYIGTLRLPYDLAEEARGLARAQDISLARLVQEAVREYIQHHGVPKVLLLRNGSTAVVTVLQQDGEPKVVSQFFVGHDVDQDELKLEVEKRTGFTTFVTEELG